MNEELENLIKAVNEIIETCRNCGFCVLCPYWNRDTGECRVQMESKSENPPYKW